MLILLMSLLMQAMTPALRTLDKGLQSQVDAARQTTTRSAADWQALWKQHAPDRPLPPVDFDREMVVGVFLGSRPTAGYGVEILNVRSEGGGLTVVYRETSPAPDRILAQVLTFPYHLVAVPVQAGTVRFEKSGS